MKRYTCTACGWRFYDKIEAEQHLKKHDGKRIYCKLCGLYVQDWRELAEHIDKEHFKNKIHDDTYVLKNIDPEYFRRQEQNDWS